VLIRLQQISRFLPAFANGFIQRRGKPAVADVGRVAVRQEIRISCVFGTTAKYASDD